MSVLSQAQTATKACNWFIFHFCVYFPRETTKRLPFLRQSASITYILFLYMAVSTCLTSISRKVPPSELPATVTRTSFLPAYLFALMYASAPEKFLHPSDNSSPDLSRPCGHYSCWETEGILTPLPLVTLVAACRRFDNLFIKVHFYEQTVNDEYFLFSFN